ncbi:MAG: hypothetical protein H7644_04075 [Candidatus Heimdallarchaeota archaeon]|nr:hypothetical protein [Candidatus Heimdallarchaeota archaeon]MCK5142921.1 hypothetical protein [Candidatus Heimdallarchaeota archaeon]
MATLRNFKTKRFSLRRISKKNLYGILTIISISILLFALSLYVKNLISEWYWKVHGAGFNWLHYEGTEVVRVWYLEAYSDASFYYEPYLESFRYENWNPYAGGEGPLNGYAYGPMFIYGLYFVSLFVSLFFPQFDKPELISESVKWTHIVFDALSVVMVYLIVITLKTFKNKTSTKHALGILSAAIFAMMPINLLYVDSVFLNTPQMTFFTLISLLLFIKDKYRLTAFFLSVAWLSKQMPLFLLIPWFLIIWKKIDLRAAFRDFLFPFLLSTLILSLPWLFMTPVDYAWRVFGPGKPLVILDLEHSGHTVSLAHSFLFLGNLGLANFYHVINKYMIPFLLFYGFTVVFAYFNGKKIGGNESYQIIFATWIIINTHLFISRGIYKYYNAFITPFVVLSLLTFIEDKSSNLIKRIKLKKFKHLSDIKMELSTDKENYMRTDNERISFGVISAVFILVSGLFYYFNFTLIAKSRYLHPLFLLILFVVMSLLLPPSIYLSIFDKRNYKMIKTDVIYIYNQTKFVLKRAKSSFNNALILFYNKLKQGIMGIKKLFDK